MCQSFNAWSLQVTHLLFWNYYGFQLSSSHQNNPIFWFSLYKLIRFDLVIRVFPRFRQVRFPALQAGAFSSALGRRVFQRFRQAFSSSLSSRWLFLIYSFVPMSCCYLVCFSFHSQMLQWHSCSWFFPFSCSSKPIWWRCSANVCMDLGGATSKIF